jgi:peptide-methionine (S)-S-oxide reductase
MKEERAILAGGCFWGMQDLIRRLDGVISTRVGYTGGDVPNATYRNHGTHAEAIEIVGLSYRSAIFYTSDEQKRIAEATIADVESSGLWPGKVVTEVSPASAFWEAEPEHQDYLERIPHGYTCHFIRPDWKLPTRKEAGQSGTRAAE